MRGSVKQYDVLFIDLDDTLYDFTANSLDAYREVYALMGYERWFRSFEHYYEIYWARNRELWVLYADNKITKDQLNADRYTHPLHVMGVADADAVGARFWEESMRRLPLGTKLMPHAREILEYLRSRYRLYILSNGFAELQARKMQSAGIGHYFDGVVLSEDIGVNKPHREIFEYALRVADVAADRALMIGDNYEVDIKAAQGVGIDQVYYNPAGKELVSEDLKPTYIIPSLLELEGIL